MPPRTLPRQCVDPNSPLLVTFPPPAAGPPKRPAGPKPTAHSPRTAQACSPPRPTPLHPSGSGPQLASSTGPLDARPAGKKGIPQSTSNPTLASLSAAAAIQPSHSYSTDDWGALPRTPASPAVHASAPQSQPTSAATSSSAGTHITASPTSTPGQGRRGEERESKKSKAADGVVNMLAKGKMLAGGLKEKVMGGSKKDRMIDPALELTPEDVAAAKVLDVEGVMAAMEVLVSDFPCIKVRPLTGQNVVASLKGPTEFHDGSSCEFGNVAYGRSVSGYPHIPINPTRDGYPICDCFSLHLYRNRVIATITDGCNWGEKPRNAAWLVNSRFSSMLMENQDLLPNTQAIARLMLKAVFVCQAAILENANDIWEAGCTTLLGGIVVETTPEDAEPSGPRRFAFVAVGIGDCKAYIFKSAYGNVTDITLGNRTDHLDPCDPGGRLGPYTEEGAPDLRNLQLYFEDNLAPGDFIFIVSDGVHDNLDPQTLGVPPSECGISTGFSTWEDVPPTNCACGKAKYSSTLLLKLIKEQPALTPQNITNALVDHALAVTQSSRDWMMENHKARKPKGLPGKMDHTTCACFVVPGDGGV